MTQPPVWMYSLAIFLASAVSLIFSCPGGSKCNAGGVRFWIVVADVLSLNSSRENPVKFSQIVSELADEYSKVCGW